MFNAETAAAIEENLAQTDCGTVLSARGNKTVALDDTGQKVQDRPDGRCTAVLNQSP